MTKHRKELASVPFHNGQYRFCLDEVVRDDEDNRIEFAFVWRGSKVSPDAFIPKPAYFDWELLGQTIRKAVKSGELPQNEFNAFIMELMDLNPKT